MRKPKLTKAPPKMTAFAEMISEDIVDAINHNMNPSEIAVALLMFAAATALEHADMDPDQFMSFAADAWNDRADRWNDALKEEEEAEKRVKN